MTRICIGVAGVSSNKKWGSRGCPRGRLHEAVVEEAGKKAAGLRAAGSSDKGLRVYLHLAILNADGISGYDVFRLFQAFTGTQIEMLFV